MRKSPKHFSPVRKSRKYRTHACSWAGSPLHRISLSEVTGQHQVPYIVRRSCRLSKADECVLRYRGTTCNNTSCPAVSTRSNTVCKLFARLLLAESCFTMIASNIMRLAFSMAAIPAVSAFAFVPAVPYSRPAFALVPAVHARAPYNEAVMQQGLRGFVADRAPGLVVCGTIGFAAEALAKRTAGLSPLLWATIFGIAIGNTYRSVDPTMKQMKGTETGMKFAKQRLLRAGIILYGAKITFGKIFGIGLAGLLTDLYSVSSTLVLGFGIGKALGLSEALVTLISTGSAICGCSAVAATQPIINAEAHEVAAAVGTVVLCGTAAMFLYPFLFSKVPALAANPRLMGIYTGASVHELAGVVAAGNAMGADVASTAVITKLLRVFLLEPWIIALYYLGIGQKKDPMASLGFASSGGTNAAGSKKKGKGVPWFAFGFVGVATVNSIWGIPSACQRVFTTLSAAFLASAMAALGLDTDLVKVRSLGWKPVVLAAALWANLLVGSLCVARFLVGAL